MKKFLTLLMAVGLISANTYAAAETKIGVVDLQKALETVKAGKAAKSSLEKEFGRRQKKLKDEEENIKKMYQEFQKQSLVMSEAARAKKQKEIEERMQGLQKNAMEAQTEMQQKQAEMTQPLIKGLQEIIAEEAKKKGYTVVLEKSRTGVLYSLQQDDLTDEVISLYNKKH